MSDPGLLRGMITLVTLVTFLGICWWAYRPGNRSRFEQDALLAFDEDETDRLEQRALRNGEGKAS